MSFSISLDPPSPKILRARSPWLAEGTAEIAYNGQDENHLTNGYLTTGLTINKGQYVIKEKLGRGAFGAVCRAEDKFFSHDVAIKFHAFSVDALNELRNYNEIYQKPDLTKIPAVFQFFRLFHNGVPYVGVAMEMLGPTVFRTVHNCGAFPISFATLVMRNILEGMHYLHEVVGISHLDVSPANIVFKQHFTLQRGTLPPTPHIRIIDFNTSEKHENIGNCTRYVTAYRAPEVCLRLNYTKSADIWAVGGIGFFMVRGMDLFMPISDAELIFAQQKAFGKVPEKMLNECFGIPFVNSNGFHNARLALEGNLAKSVPRRYLNSFFDLLDDDQEDYFLLLRAMFEMDYHSRPPASALLTSPLFTRYVDPAPEVAPTSTYEPPKLTPIPRELPAWAHGPFPFHIPVDKYSSNELNLPAPRWQQQTAPPIVQQSAAAPTQQIYPANYFGPNAIVDPVTGAPLACPYQSRAVGHSGFLPHMQPYLPAQ